MSIRLTATAAQAIRSALLERGHGLGVRLEISVGGNSGLGYRLQFADELGESELSFRLEGVCVITETRNLPYLEGLVLDYGLQGEDEGFFVHHADTCGGCGCAEGEACD